MRKVTLAMTALLLVIAMPMLAQAQMIFDFNGQSFINDITGQVSMVSEMFDPAPAPMPLPLDFGAYDYTLVIMDLELESVAGFTEHYINGSIAIIQDTVTPADYASPATFVDGTAILTGTVIFCDRTFFPMTSGGAGVGSVDWTGGTMLDEFSPLDRLEWDLAFAISQLPNYVEPGYIENWDGKVETETIIANEKTTWSRVKSLF